MSDTKAQSLCSGYGQWHSPNNERDPRGYITVSLADIEKMIENPPSVPKENAQWFIPSILLSRVHSEQRETGRFYALWADIDHTEGLSFEDVILRCRTFMEGFIAYTSRSATADNQKSRIIVPLSDLVSGADYLLLQKILNDKLQQAGITPDRATERAGQVCYLPNRGEFWGWNTQPGTFSPTLWADDMEQERERIKVAGEALQEAKEQSRIKAHQRIATGCKSPVDAFNAEYSLTLMLATFGYTQRGKRWLSPNSESGVPGVTITEDGQKWLSLHGSDSAIGRATATGTMGDAFDLFIHYEHRGDRNAATKAAGTMVAVGGATITKANQQAHMQRQSDQAAIKTLTVINADEPPFSLTRFSLNGQAANMEGKMLDDKFVLGRMAIIGQSTVFYAKPNAGKTLLTIWLLIEAIKKCEISGDDAFYVNADDNYKGLVHKLKLAEEHGFQTLAPSFNGFKCDQLQAYLNAMITDDSAHGKVLILDTVKKFTDLMSKTTATEFGKSVRDFVSHGGTVIMLAHVNKHRDDDKKVIYAGTADLVDDADCAYTLDTVTEDAATGLRTVKFENFKARGDVEREAVYRYDYSDSAPYDQRLESVIEVGEQERRDAEKQKRLCQMLERNRNAVDVITECIEKGFTKKTELVTQASERSGISKPKITKALNEHTGASLPDNQFWHVNKLEKNAHVYALNLGVS